MRATIITSIFFAFIFVAGAAQSEQAPLPFLDLASTSPEFTVAPDFSGEAFKPGSVVVGSIYVTAPPGWHIYAPGVKKYRRLEMTSGDGPLIDVQFSYPPVKVMTLLGEEVPVYEGRVEIIAQGIVAPDTIDGGYVWRPVISWQGCAENICLAPETRTLQITIAVNDKEKR
ncbi:hypothetical protein MNBD_NITROSPINAE04-1199 [hydrothermal vent metagenome]|uniref:Thiol:disulfide interchange protein DsbD N-terminal domain-containing protein n=1 Tax=hydrothermal vent metagenome TaxID=652676 RepID=A0A3B1CB79_9ZZZZ